MRLATGLANDAENSLNWLAGHKDSTGIHKKHSALWRHLCDEGLRRQSTAPCERQGTDVAVSALLKGMSDYSVSSSPRNLASHKKTAVSLPSGVHKPMVSGGGTTANEAGFRRNRGSRVASGPQ